MQNFKWYRNGQDIRPFTDEAYKQLGLQGSGWLLLSDQEQEHYDQLNTYPEWQTDQGGNSEQPVEDQLLKEVDTYADLASLPTDRKYWVQVRSDESIGNKASMTDGSNPTTVYIHYPITGFIQQVNFAS